MLVSGSVNPPKPYEANPELGQESQDRLYGGPMLQAQTGFSV